MKSLYLGAAALALSSCPALAGDVPLYQPAPGWVKPVPTLDPARIAAGPSTVVADAQTRIEKGQVWSYTDIVVRIDTPEALTQASILNGAWMPDHGDFIVHRAQILRGTEVIDLLGTDKFEVIRREAQLEQRVLDGSLTATMPVKGLRVGDALRLSLSITNTDMALGGRVQEAKLVPGDDAPMGFARMELTWPKDEKLVWKVGPQLYLPPTAEKVVDGWRVLSVPVGTRRYEMPADAPQRFLRKTTVQIGDFADWPTVSRTMAPLFATDGLIAAESPLAAEVKAIENAHADPLGRTAAALALVQGKVSYLLMGMNGGNYVPQTPAHTWEVRYGDCKAKSLLLLSMLRAMGIEAEAVLINASADDMLPEVLPMPGDFDHVIVRAVIDGQDYWLDGTRTVTQPEDIADTPAFRYALPLRPQGAELMPIAWRAPARPIIAATGTLDASGGIDMPMPFTLSMVLRGDLGALLHLADTRSGQRKRNEMVETMTQTIFTDARIGEGKVDWDDARGVMTITASGVTTPDWTFDHGTWRLPLRFGSESPTFAPDRARAVWKDVPVATRPTGAFGALLGSVSAHLDIRLPDGGTGFAIEGETVADENFAGVLGSRRIVLTGADVTYDEQGAFTGEEIPVEAIPAVRARSAQAKAREPKLVAPSGTPRYWQVAPAERRARYAGIEAAYGAIVARSPDSQSSYAWRGWFRERAGDRKGALADYGKAIDLEPTLYTYQARAALFENMGKPALALADYTAAGELDPADDGIAAARARLLVKTGKPAEANALMDERIANAGSDSSGLYVAYADLLIRQGRGADAIAMLDERITSRPGDPELLNSRCWVKATSNLQLDTALKDCTKAIELSDNPASALDSRAVVYYRMGRMEDASADLDAALQTAPDSGGSLFMRGVVNTRLGTGNPPLDLAAARELYPLVDDDYRLYGIEP